MQQCERELPEPVDERTMLDLLVQYVQDRKLRVGSPDYQATSFYQSQWKCRGSTYYWSVGKGPVIAIRTPGGCYFSVDGLNLDQLQ